jgi:hypothetical protein
VIWELDAMLRLGVLAFCFSAAGMIDFAILSAGEVPELWRAAALALLLVAALIQKQST